MGIHSARRRKSELVVHETVTDVCHRYGACIQGIVMQALKKTGEDAPDVNPSEAETGITALCDSMKASGTPASLSNWCYSETANAFAQQAAEATGTWANAGVDSPSREHVRDIWGQAIKRCGTLGVHAAGCQSRLAELVMTTTYGLAGPTRDLCTVFRDPTDRRTCTRYVTR